MAYGQAVCMTGYSMLQIKAKCGSGQVKNPQRTGDMSSAQSQARWNQLLSRKRLGQPDAVAEDQTRTDFQRDFDRIIFSSAFRRLQDKTQVFPLARNDYVRPRLTHTLEVASVGRTLGTRAGVHVIQRHAIQQAQAADFGAIVAAACLAHDIGNPPFGHSGEDAIRDWFHRSPTSQAALAPLAMAEREDLLNFEGNAQGFRVLTRLQNAANPGGLQLTCATLGAFSKYPCGLAQPRPSGTAWRKFGFLQADRSQFAELAEHLGLRAVAVDVWQRPPLVYLVEAADDICYCIVDIEDAYRLRQLDYREAVEVLTPLVEDTDRQTRLGSITTPKERIEYLRAKAIGRLIDQTVEAFLTHEAAIVNGDFDRELLTCIPHAQALALLRQRAAEQVYIAPPVIEVGAAGFHVLAALLETFVAAVDAVAAHGFAASPRQQMLLRLVPEQFVGTGHQPIANPYQRLLGITDFVSGMTDSYAIELYRKLHGIAVVGA